MKSVESPKAALVCVGSELLAGQVNTHQAWLSVRLRRAGFEMVGEASVPDDVKRIADAFRWGLEEADLVVVCGGLGPTFDDVTREAAAQALGRAISFEPALWRKICRRFARYRMKEIPEENKRQAMVLEGAEVLDNANGSAPGQRLRAGRKTLLLLPGPATEMYPMFEAVLPRLARDHARAAFPASFSVRLSGVPESIADERLDPVRARWPGARFTILASGGEVSFHATVLAASKAAALSARAELRREILDVVGEFAHGEDDATLESALGERLRRKRLTLAVAESCTGGLLGGRLTSVPGASEYFLGGVVVYSNEAKNKLAGVPARVLEKFGAVSSQCAEALARGARRALRADLGIGITGVAGPGGGTKKKPVGLVYVAVSGPGARSSIRTLEINGPRESVRSRAVTSALRLAFDALLLALVCLLPSGCASPALGPASIEVRPRRSSSYRWINPLLECVGPENDAATRPFESKLQKLIDASTASGRVAHVALYYRDLRNGPVIGINPREMFLPASLLKAPMLVAVLREVEAAPELWTELLEIPAVPPVPQFFQKGLSPLTPGSRRPVSELVQLMIATSDNIALETLYQRFGAKGMGNLYNELGVLIPDDGIPDFLGVRDYAAIFRLLYNASYLSRPMSETALQILSRCDFDQGLVAGLPPNLPVAHKYGERALENGEKQLHDCGIVYYPQHPYVLCVMTRGNDWMKQADVIRDISRLAYQEVHSQFP